VAALPASVPGRLTAVDVQRLARDERGALEIENALDDVGDLPDAAKRVEARVPGLSVTGREPRADAPGCAR
jgi:hypothetical protein